MQYCSASENFDRSRCKSSRQARALAGHEGMACTSHVGLQLPAVPGWAASGFNQVTTFAPQSSSGCLQALPSSMEHHR